MIDIFLAKFYKAIIIVLMAFLLLGGIGLSIQSWRVDHCQAEYQLLDVKFKTQVAESQALTEKAKAEAASKEKQWSEQLLKAEQNYNVKIKQVLADATRAQSVADRLSKQLDTAKSRMSTAPKETIIKYVNTSSDILKECVDKYRTMAEAADGHAVDVGRLSEGWPE
ncbi:hypothetical protein [Acinetobacter rudis]|uniref:DUF2514 family protein n=1 Tax=Acinetobacter rudis TaxID=632955 RepID=A0AAW8J915_9GAMM|nr:hypothetical protein [Acinetobacter rudis]MDQ8936661.1 hypothetical protein [Acinetobacter rudis]MDQ9018853.1 hypothetical protein [Acinetobacter rudis]